ncbi:MAG: Radical domain protein [Ferruginibacter sp.]|nr:Radical domain protein [Ferruginibacter sp.]
MLTQPLYETYQRFRTLQTHKISSLPIVILMPHSACNCRCTMCDIWKGNQNLRQLSEADIERLLCTLKKMGTKRVLMSGGEALLNSNFFRFCEMLRKEDINITLLSTGLTLKKNAASLVKYVNDIIVSLDGDEVTHDSIRNIHGAFKIMADGIQEIRSLSPGYRIGSRTVIHRLNFNKWIPLLISAKIIGISQVSFLPADVSSHAFNRQQAWDVGRQEEILLSEDQLPALQMIIKTIVEDWKFEFESGFIAESPLKLQQIHDYYSAFYGKNPFPYKKCNAPWVSTVVEADGTVRPCFFHEPLGNIHDQTLEEIINSEKAIRFRKNLRMETNSTCLKCVCTLNLSPRAGHF